MAKKKAAGKGHQLQEPSAEGLEAAQATAAGAEFVWHFGRVTSLGSYQAGEGRGVTIAWEEGGSTSHADEFPEATWEIFRMAFKTAGRIAVLSDQDEGWWYDYRYVEALR